MKYLPKDVHKLKDKELLEHLSPKTIPAKLKKEIHKPKPKLVKKKLTAGLSIQRVSHISNLVSSK